MDHSIDLNCHPSTHSDAVSGVRAVVSRSANGALEFAFRIVGDVARIRVPTPRAARIAEGLWRHTSLEAFIAIEGRNEYHEFNFAPSGEWTAYAFRGYRDGVVYLAMKGSCSGCPSSTATLKHGIQNLLRHFVPDVTEVRPI